MKFLKKIDPFFWLYLATALVARFYNFSDRLYFIWDQGRDSWELLKIIQGNPSLIGPTSGLPGFYLGAYWFYLGIPGFVLGNGDPYISAVVYTLIGCISLPLFWILAHKIFTRKSLALCSVFAYAVAPGALHWAIFIWNPIMSLPLVVGTILCFISIPKLPENRRLAITTLGFFLLAMTLQSEFAYGIFLIGPLWLLLPWILRRKLSIKEWIIVTIPILLTLIPQVLFDLRNSFLMTKALWVGVTSAEMKVSWTWMYHHRPNQLIDATREMLVGGSKLDQWFGGIIATTSLFAALSIWTPQIKKILSKAELHTWKILSLFYLLPYIGFLLWRGNYGYFFDYYLTPHILLMIPFIFFPFRVLKDTPRLFLLGLLLGSWTMISVPHWRNTVLHVENNAGLAVMMKTVQTVYDWQAKDGKPQSTVLVYTPNVRTEHYDYLFRFEALKHNLAIPLTVKTGSEPLWYIIIEPDPYGTQVFLQEQWYKKATESGALVQREKVGDLTLEKWVNIAPIKK